MGTDVVCNCVNALSGTWPPFGYGVFDGAGPDSSGDAGAVAEVPPAITPDDPVCADTAEGLLALLDGPNEAVVEEPPETVPADEPDIPDRI